MNRRRSGSLLRWVVIAVIVGVALNVIFDRSEKRPEPPPQAGTAAGAAGPALAYALDTARATWPPLDDTAPEAAASPTTANYYIVLDGSGSMRRFECSGDVSKIEAAIAALQTFVGRIPAEEHMGLAVFDDAGLSERVPLGAGNRATIASALGQVRANGGTPLASAIQLGYDRLTRQARRQLGYGEYHLVLVTDGHADPKHEDPTDAVNRMLMESPVLLHTIGFCIGTQHVLNQPGRVFYLAADDPQQLASGLESVLAEAPTFDVSRFGQ